MENSRLSVKDICKIAADLRDCDSATFLASHDDWYNKLIAPIEHLSRSTDSVELTSVDSNLVPRAAVIAFCRLLAFAAEFPDVARDLNSLKLHRLIRALAHCPSWFDHWALLGLNTCLTYFRDGCRKNFANTVVPFIIRCMNNYDEKVRRQTAHCLALFPQLAGNSARSGAWNQQLNAVLLYLHETIVQLVEPFMLHDSCGLPAVLTSGVSGSIEMPQFFTQIFDESNSRADKTAAYLEHKSRLLMDVLRFMLAEYDVLVVTVNVQYFVDLFLCLISMVEKLKLQRRILFDLVFELAAIIGNELLQVTALLTAPFAMDFVSGATRLLSICRTDPRKVNEGVFELLTGLAKYVGPASLPAFQRMVSKSVEFTEHLLQFENGRKTNEAEASLKPATAPRSNSAQRKAKKRNAILMEEMSSDRSVTNHRTEIATEKRTATITACFRMWQCFLRTGSAIIKTNDFRQLQQLICRLLLQIQTGPRKRNNLLSLNAPCRRELYGLLAALVASPHPFRPSVLQCAVRIFEVGFRRDANAEVVEACRIGSSICAVAAKPQAPYLETVVVDAENSDSTTEIIVTQKLDEEKAGQYEPDHPAIASPVTVTSTRESEFDEQRRDRSIVNVDEAVSAPTVSDPNTMQPANVAVENVRHHVPPDDTITTTDEVTIDDDNDSDVVLCDEEEDSPKQITVVSAYQKNHANEDRTTEVNALLATFVDEPLEDTSVFID